MAYDLVVLIIHNKNDNNLNHIKLTLNYKMMQASNTKLLWTLDNHLTYITLLTEHFTDRTLYRPDTILTGHHDQIHCHVTPVAHKMYVTYVCIRICFTWRSFSNALGLWSNSCEFEFTGWNPSTDPGQVVLCTCYSGNLWK